MKVLVYDIPKYCDTENDLCKIHSVPEDHSGIDSEHENIMKAFSRDYSNLVLDEDYEFSDWHNYTRMLWVYLYHDCFYSPTFIPKVQKLLSDFPTNWFAQFECYSPSLESEDLPTGSIGTFILYKETIIFSKSPEWDLIRPKIGL